MSDVPVLSGRELTYRHADGARTVTALCGVSLALRRERLTVVVGPSGSGKTTLLTLLGLLRTPDEGLVAMHGTDTTALAHRARAALRARLGLAFQEPRFLDGLDLLDNVGYGLVPRGVRRAERRRLAYAALDRVGLAACATQESRRISGGERRRAGLARALVTSPDALLVDEPTSGLDPDTAAAIAAELETERRRGAALLVVTHDPAHFPGAAEDVRLRAGRRV